MTRNQSRSLPSTADQKTTDGPRSVLLSYLFVFLSSAAVLTLGPILFVQMDPPFLISSVDIAPMLAANTATAVAPIFDSDFGPFASSKNSISFERPEHAKLEGTFKRQWMILPNYKLLFCTIAKAGSSALRSFGKEVSNCRKKNAQLCNRPIDHLLSDEHIVSILKNDTWTKAIFFRDPIQRFISAYKDKCYSRKHDRHCYHLSDTKQPLSIDDYVKAMTDPSEHSWEADSHWASQIDMCGGLANVIGFFDVVGMLTNQEETSAQMKQVLLKKHFQMSPILSKALNKVFDPGTKSNETLPEPSAVNQGQEEELNMTEESLKLLKAFYKKDYDLFQSLPQHPSSTLELKNYVSST